MIKRLPRRMPKPTMTDSAEREYYKHLRDYANTFKKLLKDGLADLLPGLKDEAAEELPTVTRVDSAAYRVSRMDANIEKSLRILIDQISRRLKEIYPDTTLQSWSKRMTENVNRLGKTNIKKLGKTIDLDMEPFMKDGKLSPYFQNVVDENVGLIRSIAEERMPAFKNQLVAMITQDAPQDQIRKAIQKKFDLTDSHARLIARDQVNKLNGAVNQYRQQQLGGKRYIWRTVKDARVRHDHEELDGTIQLWSKPPIVDRATRRRAHPGGDFQCRCYAEMIMEDVIQ